MVRKGMKRRFGLRKAFQIGFLLFILSGTVCHFLERRGIELGWVSFPNLHAVCPFGAVETAGRLLLEGRFIQKLNVSNLWIFLGSILGTLFLGAAFCGYLCPLGSVQEWVGKMGRKIFHKRYVIHSKVDRALGYLRYGLLVLIVVQTTRMLTLVFKRFDPYYALMHFWTGDVLPSALIVLAVVLMASLIVERPWCRWLCPFGGLQGIIQCVSPWKIRRDEQGCTGCRACSKACPMHIPLHRKGSLLDTRCNRCGLCIDACPRPGALTLSFGKSRALPLRNGLITGAVLLSLFVTPLLFARYTGMYDVSNGSALAEGRLTPQEVKGTMTIAEVSKGFDIEPSMLREIVGLSEEVREETRLMDLEDIDVSVTTRVVRERLSSYLSKNGYD